MLSCTRPMQATLWGSTAAQRFARPGSQKECRAITSHVLELSPLLGGSGDGGTTGNNWVHKPSFSPSYRQLGL